MPPALNVNIAGLNAPRNARLLRAFGLKLNLGRDATKQEVEDATALWIESIVAQFDDLSVKLAAEQAAQSDRFGEGWDR